MTPDDLTAIRRDLARYEALAAMDLHTYVATVNGNEVTELRNRLVKAVPVLVARAEQLEAENKLLRQMMEE